MHSQLQRGVLLATRFNKRDLADWQITMSVGGQAAGFVWRQTTRKGTADNPSTAGSG